MKIFSPFFEEGKRIPEKYTCDGEDVNPPLKITEIPSNAKSLVLIVEDPDATKGVWAHWIVFNIPVCEQIEENSIPGIQGINDFKITDWKGPSPPIGQHRYFFKLYALDTIINLEEGAFREQIETAMKNHILASTQLIGVYQRK